MMTTLSSLVAPEVVVLTTYGATSNDKVGIMMTLFSVHYFTLQCLVFLVNLL